MEIGSELGAVAAQHPSDTLSHLATTTLLGARLFGVLSLGLALFFCFFLEAETASSPATCITIYTAQNIFDHIRTDLVRPCFALNTVWFVWVRNCCTNYSTSIPLQLDDQDMR